MESSWRELEEIRALKARYCRYLDTQRWDDLRELFLPDAAFDFTSGNSFSDASAALAYVAKVLTGRETVHHVLAPEIELTGPASATGIWAMRDIVGPRRAGEQVLRGYGHYHETYRKDDGRWRIASLRLTRLRVELTDA